MYLLSLTSAVTLQVAPVSEYGILAPGPPPHPLSWRYLHNTIEASTQFYCRMSSTGWHAQLG